MYSINYKAKGMKMKKWLFLTILVVFLCGSANAMTERMWWLSGTTWTEEHVATVNYKAMARDYMAVDPTLAAFGAREDGSALVKIVSDNGGVSWHEILVTYRNYKALAGIKTSASGTIKAGALGILDSNNVVQFIRQNASNVWLVSDINVVGVGIIDDYKALAYDSLSNVGSGQYTFYGARTDGSGVDQIYSSDNGVTWNINSLITNHDYKAMCSMMHNGFAGALADGSGLERVWYTTEWNIQQASSSDFVALAEDILSTGPAYGIFGSMADGSGVKRALFNGTSWSTSNIWPEYYKTLAALGHPSHNMVIGSYNCDKSIYDLNNDCKVDFADFAYFAAEWLDCGKESPGSCI